MTRSSKPVNTNSLNDSPESRPVIRPGFVWPLDLWNEVRKAAIDKGINPRKLVIDLVAERYPAPDGKRAS